MPRYLVERTFPDGLAVPMTEAGVQVCLTVVGNNAMDGVTWVHSYVTPDKEEDLLYLRCAFAGSHPHGSETQQLAGGYHYASKCA